MPGRTLPTISTEDIASQKTLNSCYVTVGTKVYDVTPFLEDHPGGKDLILEHGGKDVMEIMDNPISHRHSDSAYDMLEEHLIGFIEPNLKTTKQSRLPDDLLPLQPNTKGTQEIIGKGVDNDKVLDSTSLAAELSMETDPVADYREYQFLDLSKPLLMQVWNGGFQKDVYLKEVHRPRHYPGGESAPLFGNFLEPLTKTAWYVIPMVWLPPAMYGSFIAYQNLPSLFQFISYWLTGLGLWTLIEYGLHRGLFHIDKLVNFVFQSINHC